MALLDIAEWRGPTANHNGAMGDYQGLVVHIADGYYDGTISWAKNGTSGMSCHFVAGKNGELAQILDTSLQSWCQADGNSRWLSVECVGFTGDALTVAQLETVARLFAELHRIHGIPLQLANSPDGHGLGHHSMGGAAWGGHYSCPGDAIIAQKPQIITRAQALVEGGDDMASMAEQIAAMMMGMPQAPDGSPICPTRWQIATEKHQAKVEATLAVLAKAPAPVAPVALTEQDRQAIIAQVSAQVLAGVEDTVRRVLGSLDNR
jgi:hypothetical protein